MAPVIANLLTVLLLLGGSLGEVMKRCNLFDGSGCKDEGHVFNFTYTGMNPKTDSECRMSYQLTVKLPPGILSFECRLEMDVPEEDKYMYSISMSPVATASSTSTAFVYGKGKDAYIEPRAALYNTMYAYRDNYMKYHDAHTHPDENRYSHIIYRFHDGKMTMRSSSGQAMRMGHDYLFNPTMYPIYIGLNRNYASPSYKGTGLCKVHCYTTNSLYSPEIPNSDWPIDQFAASSEDANPAV